MIKTTFQRTIIPPWTELEPVKLGAAPVGQGTPDHFLVVEDGEEPLLRMDLYRSSEESFAFQEACLWSGFVVIGWGHRVYVVEVKSRAVASLDLGSYFGHLYPLEQCLLIASADRLFHVESTGKLLWKSHRLGVDGVIVDRICEDIVQGKGEWNPPGEWRAFQVSLRTGQEVL